jgi:signal transduction histidine kinase/DNA-binding response OmpR family regulator/ligand-binding sensor domain-containing protein
MWRGTAFVFTGLQLILHLGLFSSEATAQSFSQSSTHLTTNNGLPHNAVTGVEQDKAGFVWIATHDGLARYDGRLVKVFRHRPGDTTSLIDNKIAELNKTTDGQLLITTESGTFQLFDPKTERFATLLDRQFMARNKAPVTQGQLSADGQHLWGILPDTRLIDYQLNSKTLKVYEVAKLVGKPDLHDFILTNSGYIYGYCQGGLLQFDTKTKHSRIVPLPIRPLTTSQDGRFWPINRHKVVEAPNGQIAIFGIQTIVLFDPIQNKLRTVPIPDVMEENTVITRRLATVVSYAMKTMADGRLYLGYMNRVYCLNENDQFKLLQPPSPALPKVAPWLLDGSGVLWISGASAGLSQLDVHALPFAFSPRQKSFNEDLLEQNLGVSIPDHFEVWDNDRWPRYNLAADGTGYLTDPSRVYHHLPNKHVLTELTDLWLNQGKACCKLCLKISRQGHIWLYNNNRGLVESDHEGKNSRLYPNSLVPILESKTGYDAGDIQPMGRSVWVGSQIGLGLFRYDTVQKHFDRPIINNPRSDNSLSNNTIYCLSVDPIDSTVLWIGTAGGGLCRLETRSMTFRRLNEAGGFPNNFIQSIETDDQGLLWCATNLGLVRLNPKTLTWRHFTTDDGLAENTFFQNSSAHLPDGRIVFGTPKGRVIFDPKAIGDDDYEPPLVLSSLAINNQLVEATLPNSSLSAPINTLNELVLDHTQNFLTFTFAGLDFAKPEKLSYRYQLTGVDAGWVTVGKQNTANYTQLAPGHYKFLVNSTTADGRWSRYIKQLAVVIKPPLWATWWAYALYALVVSSLLWGFVRFRIRLANQQQEIGLKRREAEQLRALDELKTRFFANIAHEFRTPLTLILSPLEKLLKAPNQDDSTRQIHTSIYQNAGQLLRLINQLLDIAKLEEGSMQVSLVRGNGVVFIKRLVEPFYHMTASKNIVLTLETSETATSSFAEAWLFDADKWEKIITNLLSNALKFTSPGGQIVLAIEGPTRDQLVVRLSDTGIGISEQHLPHIFDRFYQADTSRTRAYEGTGIGLALVKELIQLLGGTILVKSRTEAPTGTTFILSLPLLPASNQPDAPEVGLPDVSLSELALSPAVDQLPSSVAEDAPMVLIVEDNEELRTFIAKELASRYRVLIAADGQEGWEICQRELPDVVLTDVMMPRLDGLELTHRVKSTLATAHIAVVVLTARATHPSRIEGLEQGADDYLTKPFHADELFLRLDNLLTRQANLRAYIHHQLSLSPTLADEPVSDRFIQELHQVIEARLDDATLGVDDLAQAMAMSRRTLNRKLSTTANMAAIDLIRHYRLQRAIQLLRTGRSIAETAYSVGFESPSYFSKLFKQAYKQTPSEFLTDMRD